MKRKTSPVQQQETEFQEPTLLVFDFNSGIYEKHKHYFENLTSQKVILINDIKSHLKYKFNVSWSSCIIYINKGREVDRVVGSIRESDIVFLIS